MDRGNRGVFWLIDGKYLLFHMMQMQVSEYQNQEITITIDYCGIMLSQKDVINHMIIIRGEG